MIEPRNLSDRLVLDEALAQAAGIKLPVTARGRSVKEAAAYEARVDRILVPLVVLLGWMFFLPISQWWKPPTGWLVYFGVCTISTIIGLAYWRRHARGRHRHCTPDVQIEVARDSITLRKDGRVHELRYEDVEFGLTTWSGKTGAHFQGIVLETPLGPLRLEDGYFECGREAAAAILGICDGAAAAAADAA